jgi:hypothetical protein
VAAGNGTPNKCYCIRVGGRLVPGVTHYVSLLSLEQRNNTVFQEEPHRDISKYVRGMYELLVIHNFAWKGYTTKKGVYTPNAKRNNIKDKFEASIGGLIIDGRGP